MMYLNDKDMSPIMPRHQSHNASGQSKRVRIIGIIMLTKKDFSEMISFFSYKGICKQPNWEKNCLWHMNRSAISLIRAFKIRKCNSAIVFMFYFNNEQKKRFRNLKIDPKKKKAWFKNSMELQTSERDFSSSKDSLFTRKWFKNRLTALILSPFTKCSVFRIELPKWKQIICNCHQEEIARSLSNFA